MTRSNSILGWSYVAACVALLVNEKATTRRAEFVPVARVVTAGAAQPTVSPSVPVQLSVDGDAAAWFQRVKPYCNAVEVNVLQRQAPAPANVEGTGYHAACFALAGRIDDARRIIDSLHADARPSAAAIVFEVGHPVADAGDDRSAGPIMELVVSYTPDNYMAVYHAGMAEFALGQNELARRNLESFMRLYSQEDGWRSSARGALEKMNGGTRWTPTVPDSVLAQ